MTSKTARHGSGVRTMPVQEIRESSDSTGGVDLTGYRILIKVRSIHLSSEMAIPLLGVGVALVATVCFLVMSYVA